MKRLVFLTGHFPRQKRRTSMAWVTDHMQAMGWHVTYATVGYSWLSQITRDRRLAALGYRPKTGTTHFSPSLTGIFGYSPYHPVKWPNAGVKRVLQPLNSAFVSYWDHRLRADLGRADLVIIESGAPVALGEMVARHAPQATRIYRVSDDIRLLNAPQILLDAERAHHHFHRISTGSPLLAARFKDHPNVTLDPMGVPLDQIKAAADDPYPRTGAPTAVCAGSTLLDMDQMARIARTAAHWKIHVIGRLKTSPPQFPNVIWHGEKPFDQTLSYIKYADIGLAPFADVPGVEYQITNSNRMLLYRHTGLPILVPERLVDRSIPSLISNTAPDWQAQCETYGKRPEPVPDWSALTRALLQNGVTDPPDDTSTVPDFSTTLRVNTVPPLASIP